MKHRVLTALPVFNEQSHVSAVVSEVSLYSPQVLVVDDGSTDGTADALAAMKGISIVRHPRNRGYGAALATAFEYAIGGGYEALITIDCDGQHEPQRIPRFIQAILTGDAEIVSGSRYLKEYAGDAAAPAERRRINEVVTRELNAQLGFALTDAFCGFKAYRTTALARLSPHEPGYAMPLELWVQAAHLGLKVRELPVPRVYLQEKRSFGGALDDADRRLTYYREVIRRSMQIWPPSGATLPSLRTFCGEATG